MEKNKNKNKKTIGVSMVIIGGMLIVAAVILMVVGGDNNNIQLDNNNNNGNNNNNESDNSNNNGNNTSCDYKIVKAGELVLDFNCDSFNIIEGDLTFRLNKNEESGYDLNINFLNNEIYSSNSNEIMMYTDESAGKTSIINIDDLYFVYTYSAAQCGNYGHLIVVSKTGEIVNKFSGLFKFDYENKVVYVREIDELQCGNINGVNGFVDVYDVLGTTMNKYSRSYEFEGIENVTDGNLSFEFGLEQESYYLNVLLSGNKVFSSKDSKVPFFSKEQAGYTTIEKVDNVYLINTAAANQCGYKGNLIVVSGNGNVIGVFDSLDYKLDRKNKSFSFIEDKEGKCGDLTGNTLLSTIYHINGDSINK